MTKRFIVKHVDDLEVILKRYFYLNSSNVLIDTNTNKIVGFDGGEPEDQTLNRDWSWVVDLLNQIDQENKNE